MKIKDQFHGAVERLPDTFRSVYDRYDFVADETGRYHIEKIDSVDVQKMIDAASVGSSLAEQIALSLRTGDQSYLNARDTIYGDFTNLPKTLDDYQRIVGNVLDNLDKVKKLSPWYEGSTEDLRKDLLDGSFMKKLDDYNSKKEGDSK